MIYVGGVDIGGTKCAVSLGSVDEEGVRLIEKQKIPTPPTPDRAIEEMLHMLDALLKKYPECRLDSIGISCGGPLNSEKGLIMAPPNLPHWVDVDVVTPFEARFHVPTALQNDANACALAEWMWGAGKGTKNMIFLTFGTGMGAGLILNGELYSGANDMAGEVGHIRLEKEGPVGYHKAGSFEGFCSGGGIAKYAQSILTKRLATAETTSILNIAGEIERVTAADVGIAAMRQDPIAMEIMEEVGHRLGMGLSILIDILNPEKIVIGSIFLRQEQILRPYMEEIISEEALSYSRNVCEIAPAGLGEQLGDYAAFSVAMGCAAKASKQAGKIKAAKEREGYLHESKRSLFSIGKNSKIH